MKRLVFFVLFFVSVAQANESFNSHLFRFSQSLETISIESGLSPESDFQKLGHRWLLRFSYDHVNDAVLGVDINDAKNLEYIDNIQTYMLGLSYRFSEKFMLGFAVPLHSVKNTAELASIKGNQVDRYHTFGDIYIQGKLALGYTGKWFWTFVPKVFLPLSSGAKDHLVTDDSFGIGLGLAIDRTLNRHFRMHINLGFTNAANSNFLSIQRHERIEGAIGFVYTPPNDRWSLHTELLGEMTTNFTSHENPLSWISGASYRLARSASAPRFYAAMGWDKAFRSRKSHEFYFAAGIKWAFGPKVPVRPACPRPIVKKPEPQQPQVIKTFREVIKKQDEVIFEETVHFANNQFDLSATDQEKINQLLQKIHESDPKEIIVEIEGHTSSTNTKEYNLQLSQKRAVQVKDFIKEMIAPHLRDEVVFKTLGKGESELLIKDTGYSAAKNRELQARNRRAVLRVVHTVTKVIKRHERVIKEVAHEGEAITIDDHRLEKQETQSEKALDESWEITTPQDISDEDFPHSLTHEEEQKRQALQKEIEETPFDPAAEDEVLQNISDLAQEEVDLETPEESSLTDEEEEKVNTPEDYSVDA